MHPYSWTLNLFYANSPKNEELISDQSLILVVFFYSLTEKSFNMSTTYNESSIKRIKW